MVCRKAGYIWWRQSIPELVVQVAGGDLEDHLGVPPGVQVRHLQQ